MCFAQFWRRRRWWHDYPCFYFHFYFYLYYYCDYDYHRCHWVTSLPLIKFLLARMLHVDSTDFQVSLYWLADKMLAKKRVVPHWFCSWFRHFQSKMQRHRVVEARKICLPAGNKFLPNLWFFQIIIPNQKLDIDRYINPWSNFLSSWLVVSTHLKNMSQNGNLPQIEVKIKNVWNHQLASLFHLGKFWAAMYPNSALLNQTLYSRPGGHEVVHNLIFGEFQGSHSNKVTL